MVPVRLRTEFSEEHTVETVEYRKWKGVPNGAILPRAEEAGFECLVTRDRSLPEQQNLSAFIIAVLVVEPAGQALRHWKAILPDIERELKQIRPGEMRRVSGRSRGAIEARDHLEPTRHAT